MIGTNAVLFVSDTGSAPAASTTTAGIQRNATQTEANNGTANTTVTSDVLAGWTGRALRYAATVGDGSVTSIDVTHNLGSEDVDVTVRDAAGNKAVRLVEWRVIDTNTIRLLFDTTAPALNSLRVTVKV